jgi:hypothetical protein
LLAVGKLAAVRDQREESTDAIPNADPARYRDFGVRLTLGVLCSYGLTTGHEANEWFIDMLYQHEEFEVEADEPGEPPLSFWTETVRGVMVE